LLKGLKKESERKNIKLNTNRMEKFCMDLKLKKGDETDGVSNLIAVERCILYP